LEPFSTALGEGVVVRVCCVRHSFAIAWGAVTCASLAAAPARSESSIVSCVGSHSFENVEALSAGDGATLRLKDGREVRLAGVIAVNALDGHSDAAARASDGLNALVTGKSLTLYGPKSSDRYGHVVAQVTFRDDPAHWLQADLVSAGAVRVAPEMSGASCAKSLLSLEAEARAGHKGLWREARFAVEQAENIEALTTAMGRFTIVEGLVRRVGETSSRTYLDFGRRYNQDFSIMIPRSARAGFAAAGIDLKSLRGKQVRVRGVLFSSGGPAIEIRNPASLEIVAGGGT
jgi:endonuclease YncB( thermonuclease family)